MHTRLTCRQRAKPRQFSFCSSWGGSLHTSSAPTQGHPSPGRSTLPCFAAESVRADTLRALPEGAASPSRKVSRQTKHPAIKQHTKPRQPTPPQFARHGAHILNHRAPQRTGGIPRPPEPQTRRGIDIPRRDIRYTKQGKTVSPVVTSGCPKRSEDGFPVGTRANTVFRARLSATKEISTLPNPQNCIYGERKNPADSEESAGFSLKCAPWDSNPEPID